MFASKVVRWTSAAILGISTVGLTSAAQAQVGAYGCEGTTRYAESLDGGALAEYERCYFFGNETPYVYRGTLYDRRADGRSARIYTTRLRALATTANNGKSFQVEVAEFQHAEICTGKGEGYTQCDVMWHGWSN